MSQANPSRLDHLRRLETIDATPSTMSFPSVTSEQQTPSTTRSLVFTNLDQSEPLPELNGPFELVTIISEFLTQNVSDHALSASTRGKMGDDRGRVDNSTMGGTAGINAAVAAAAAMTGAAEAVTAGFARLKGSSSMLFSPSTRVSETTPSTSSQKQGSSGHPGPLTLSIPRRDFTGDRRSPQEQSRSLSPSRKSPVRDVRSPEPSHSRSIQTVEMCGSDLYVGFSDGLLGYFTLSLTLPSKDSTIDASAQRVQFMTTNSKRIDSIFAIPTESTLMILADSTLSFYKLSDLSPSSASRTGPLRTACCVCTDKLIQSPLRMSIARKKGVVPAYLDQTLHLEREIPVPVDADPSFGTSNHFIQMVQYGSSICAADHTMYKLIDTRRKEVIPLFAYDNEMMQPSLTSIGKGEFLLVTSSSVGMGMGVFISSKGEPVRGTLQWNGIPLFVGFHFPYLIAVLNTHTVQIHDIHSQELVQTLVLPPDVNPTCLSTASYPLELQEVYEDQSAIRLSPSTKTTRPETDVRPGGIVQVVLGCRDRVLGLKMIPWETQAEQLLELGRVSQALHLTHHMLSREGGAERKEKWLNSFYLRSAIGLLEILDFRNSFELLKQADVDTTGVIRIFYESCTDWEPSSFGKTSSTTGPSPLAIADIFMRFISEWERVENLVRIKSASRFAELYSQAKMGLLDYLEYAYNVKARSKNIITVTALLFLYAEFSNDKLVSFLNESTSPFPSIDIVENAFLAHQRYHALALMHIKEQQTELAVDIWLKIINGDFSDSAFTGVNMLVHSLRISQDKKLIFRSSENLLLRYPQAAIDIFTKRDDDLLDPNEVLRYLESHGSRVSRKYLHYLVNDKGLKTPEYHQKLVHYSLDDLLDLSDNTSLVELMEKFQSRSVFESDKRFSEARKTFRAFLIEQGDPLCQSRLSFVRAVESVVVPVDYSSLLVRVNSSGYLLSLEKAVLYMHLDQHRDALSILILDMKDYSAAELYSQSLWTRNEKRISKKECLQLLFEVYFEAEKDDTSHRTSLVSEITYLLGKYASDIDMTFLLERIPESWDLSSIRQFLENARKNQRKAMMHLLLQKSLYQSTQTRAIAALNDLVQSIPPIYLPREPLRVCPICDKKISDAKLFVKKSSGDIVHLQCEHRMVASSSKSSA